MIKINIGTDCGNSPKKQFLKEINIAFAKSDSDFLIASVSDKIIWDIIGDRKIEGKENFAEELEKMKSQKASELIIEPNFNSRKRRCCKWNYENIKR